MENKQSYDFCPKCGALMRDGKCISCGMTVNAFSEENNIPPIEAYESELYTESINTNVEEKETQFQDITETEYRYEPDYNKKNYYHGYRPEEQKKKNSTLAVVILSCVIIFVIALIIYIAIGLADSIEKARQTADRKVIEEYLFGTDQYNNLPKEYDQEIENSEKYWEEYGRTEGSQFVKDWKKPHENTDPSTIKGPYLDEIKDYINTSVSYQIERKFFEEIDEKNGQYIRIAYIQLKSDDRNFEKINKDIKEAAMLYADAYEKNKNEIQNLYHEYGYTYTIELDSYVTYNDEEKISIIMDTEYHNLLGGISSININLKTDTILKNTEILEIDEAFVEEFNERSRKQNGEDSYSIGNLTEEEKLQLFKDESSLILFYTPIGLEVGYNYQNNEYSGWVTISLEEYNQYLKKY